MSQKGKHLRHPPAETNVLMHLSGEKTPYKLTALFTPLLAEQTTTTHKVGVKTINTADWTMFAILAGLIITLAGIAIYRTYR